MLAWLIAEEALDCAWRSRRLGQVTALVEQVAAPMPFEENLQAQLIRALGRSGRRRDAMKLYERVRHGLVEELGVDPGDGTARRTPGPAGDRFRVASRTA